jgi:hypothetical protein
MKWICLVTYPLPAYNNCGDYVKHPQNAMEIAVRISTILEQIDDGAVVLPEFQLSAEAGVLK